MKLKSDGYGSSKEAVDYWLHHRSRLSELYPSERHFFIPIISKVKSVLDVGCAAGGSALFCKELNPLITYTGIDISSSLIDAARRRFKQYENNQFLTFDGSSIPLDDEHSELCFSFGVFHHLNHWKEMIFEAIRVSSKYVLFDIRSWEHDSLIDISKSYQKLALAEEWDQISIVPYNIISLNEIIGLLRTFHKLNISSQCYGYYQKPTNLALTPAKDVLMLSILLEKVESKPTTQLIIQDNQNG